MQSDIPKVKAYSNQLPTNKLGIEFTTEATPDECSRPGLAYWSGNPGGEDSPKNEKGVWTEDGYAKISVEITFCNQLDEG